MPRLRSPLSVCACVCVLRISRQRRIILTFVSPDLFVSLLQYDCGLERFMTGMLWLAGGISRIVVWAQHFFCIGR